MAAAVQRGRADPVWFARHILNHTGDWALDPWQVELLEAVADVWRKKQGLPTKVNHEGKQRITVRAMHGPGKTHGVAVVMHWFNFCFKSRAICTAPKEKQLTTRLWPAYRKIRSHAIPGYDALCEVNTLDVKWAGDPDWGCIAETASTPENLAGYHDDYMLFVVEEASGVGEEFFPVIEGAISTGKLVVILMIGNPTKTTGTFHDSHMRASTAAQFYRLHVDIDKTTRVSRRWVQDMVARYGEHSPVVQVRCFGNFAALDENQLVQVDWMQAALDRDSINDGSLANRRVTVDVADGGVDETVITLGDMYEGGVDFLEQWRFSFPPSESPILAATEAHRIAKQYGARDIVVDAMGVGAGTAGKLLEMGQPVIAYRGGESSDAPHLWRNRRTQSYLALRNDLRDGRVSFGPSFEAHWDDLLAQVCSVRSVPGNERVEELETKEHMKRRGLKSPDLADGLAMMYATQSPRVPIGALVAAGPKLESANADW